MARLGGTRARGDDLEHDREALQAQRAAGVVGSRRAWGRGGRGVARFQVPALGSPRPTWRRRRARRRRRRRARDLLRARRRRGGAPAAHRPRLRRQRRRRARRHPRRRAGQSSMRPGVCPRRYKLGDFSAAGGVEVRVRRARRGRADERDVRVPRRRRGLGERSLPGGGGPSAVVVGGRGRTRSAFSIDDAAPEHALASGVES